MATIINEDDIDSLTLPVVNKQPKRNMYVDNARLSGDLADWSNARRAAIAKGEEPPILPDYVGYCIQEIARGMAKKHNFSGYSFKEEMVGDAIENVLLYIGNYDPNAPTRNGEPNAFGYISRTVHFAFTRRIEHEARQAYYKYKSYELAGGSAMLEGEGEDELVEVGISDPHSIHSDFMTRVYEYELKQEERKKKQNDKGAPPPPEPTLLDFMGE